MPHMHAHLPNTPSPPLLMRLFWGYLFWLPSIPPQPLCHPFPGPGLWLRPTAVPRFRHTYRTRAPHSHFVQGQWPQELISILSLVGGKYLVGLEAARPGACMYKSRYFVLAPWDLAACPLHQHLRFAPWAHLLTWVPRLHLCCCGWMAWAGVPRPVRWDTALPWGLGPGIGAIARGWDSLG